MSALPMPAQPPADEMLDADQAAQILGVSPITVAKWGRLGKFPRYAYSPKAVRYSRSDLEEFKRRCRR